jgi:hypothetical protein
MNGHRTLHVALLTPIGCGNTALEAFRKTFATQENLAVKLVRDPSVLGATPTSTATRATGD